MTEEEEKAIEELKKEIEQEKIDCCGFTQWFEIKKAEIILNLISKLQADIGIKDKVIEKAFKYIDEHTYRDMEECEFGETNNFTCIKDCDTCIKQYFYEKVEEENE